MPEHVALTICKSKKRFATAKRAARVASAMNDHPKSRGLGIIQRPYKCPVLPTHYHLTTKPRRKQEEAS